MTNTKDKKVDPSLLLLRDILMSTDIRGYRRGVRIRKARKTRKHKILVR